MTLDNGSRGKTTQDKILLSIVERLIDQIDDLNEANCWLSDQPIPVSIPGGRFAVTVSMGNGNFPHEFFTGSGTETLVEDGSIVITPIVAVVSDRPRQKWRKITGPTQSGDTPSILYFKHAILKALLADNSWEPSFDNVPILRDMLAPISVDGPQDVRVGETMAAASQMRFSVVFDWDLT